MGVQQKHHQLRQGQAALEDGEPAHHHNGNGNQAGKGVHAAIAQGLALIAPLAALQEFLVAHVELLGLHRLVAKGLHHADGGEGILCLGVDFPHVLPALLQGGGHFLVKVQRVGQHKGQKAQDDQGHLPVDVPQNQRGAHKLDGVYQHVLGHVVEKFRQGQGIVGQAAHQVANGVAVKVGEGQPLAVGKQLGAHVPLHPGANGVALVVHKVAAQRLHQHQAQQQRPHPQDFPRGGGQVAGEDVIGDVPRPQGQHQANGRGDEGAQQICGEQPLIGLVEGQNLFQCVFLGLQKSSSSNIGRAALSGRFPSG